MTQPITFITLSADQDSAKELRDALCSNQRTRLLASCDTAEQMYADAMRLQPAAAIIVLGTNNPEREYNLVKRLAAASPSMALITAAHNASPALILSSLRAGAREFIQLPIIAEELKTVLERTEEFCQSQRLTQKKKGRVITVFSSKGGTGVSFIATNLAAAMGAPTLLADLNLQAGDLDTFLGVEPKYSIADLVKNRSRLDETLIASYITSPSANLSLLAAPSEAHEADDIKPEHIFEVMHVLREHYAYTVLDLQHTFDPITVAAMDEADSILLVLTLDIPGIRNAKRALKVFEQIGYTREKVHIIVNRWSKQVDVEMQKVEKHLGERIVGFVPNDYRKVMDSINLGQPLIQSDPSSKISVEIKRIAAMFSGGTEMPVAQPRKGFLGSIFNRNAAPAPLEFRTTLDKV
ncbi:MAG: AAA family ATPase [Pyrinomonadaceae bacterium]